MPRRAHVHLDGSPLHVVRRGHNRESCFFAEGDYNSYLHWLDKALVETECALRPYVLMTNHVRLLFTPRRAEAVPMLLIEEVTRIRREAKPRGRLRIRLDVAERA